MSDSQATQVTEQNVDQLLSEAGVLSADDFQKALSKARERAENASKKVKELEAMGGIDGDARERAKVTALAVSAVMNYEETRDLIQRKFGVADFASAGPVTGSQVLTSELEEEILNTFETRATGWSRTEMIKKFDLLAEQADAFLQKHVALGQLVTVGVRRGMRYYEARSRHWERARAEYAKAHQDK